MTRGLFNPLASVALAMLGAVAGPTARAAGMAQVLIVATSGAPAYTEALEGLRAALSSAAVSATVETLDRPGAEPAVRARLAAKPDLVIAVGSAALDLVSGAKRAAPVVATMILELEPKTAAGEPADATITLDLPPSVVLSRLKAMFPNRKRLAVIRGPALSAAAVTEIQAHAQRLGYEVRVVSCPGARELLESIGGLRDKADLVWCLPDRALYQGPTVAALALRAIRNGLLLIGFSEGLVRAGALVGFYPDYRDIGRQTGEAALRRLAQGQASPHERPRKIRAAVNERVARVLGVHVNPSAGDTVAVQ